MVAPLLAMFRVLAPQASRYVNYLVFPVALVVGYVGVTLDDMREEKNARDNTGIESAVRVRSGAAVRCAPGAGVCARGEMAWLCLSS